MVDLVHEMLGEVAKLEVPVGCPYTLGGLIHLHDDLNINQLEVNIGSNQNYVLSN